MKKKTQLCTKAHGHQYIAINVNLFQKLASFSAARFAPSPRYFLKGATVRLKFWMPLHARFATSKIVLPSLSALLFPPRYHDF